MTTMKRLLEDPGSDIDRVLLESALDEDPPPGAADKTLAALGLGSAVALGVATTTTGAVVGASAGTAIATKATATSLFGLSVAKVAGAVAVLSLFVGGAVVVNGRMKDEARSAPAAQETGERDQQEHAAAGSRKDGRDLAAKLPVQDGATSLPGAAPAAQSPSPEIVPEPGAAPIPRRTRIESVPAGARASEPARASNAPASSRRGGADADGEGHAEAKNLADEVKLLDQARHALAAGDYDACLARLDAHQKRFPRGQLAEQVATTRAAAMKKKAQAKPAP